MIAWGEALIVHRDAVVERLGIGDYRPCVPGCVQELPHKVILPNRFGTGQIEGVVERLSEGRVGHDGGDVIRRDGLYQNRWNPNRPPFRRRLGDSADEGTNPGRTANKARRLGTSYGKSRGSCRRKSARRNFSMEPEFIGLLAGWGEDKKSSLTGASVPRALTVDNKKAA